MCQSLSILHTVGFYSFVKTVSLWSILCELGGSSLLGSVHDYKQLSHLFLFVDVRSHTREHSPMYSTSECYVVIPVPISSHGITRAAVRQTVKPGGKNLVFLDVRHIFRSG